MARPRTRTELKDYVLRRLGHPVVQINVADSQVDDRIDDALQFFAEYHFEGVERVVMKHQITESEYAYGQTTGVLEVTIPDEVVSVTRVFSLNDDFTENFFNVKYQAILNDLAMWGRMDLTGYVITRDYYALLDHLLNPYPRFEHQRVKDKLRVFIQGDDTYGAGAFLQFEGYAIIDPEIYGKIYDDILLKEYATALVQRQWGLNLSKFQNMQLPGGVQFNGSELLSQANEEIRRIEDTMLNKWETPPMFEMG